MCPGGALSYFQCPGLSMALGYCLFLRLLEADQLEQASPGQTVRDRVSTPLTAVSGAVI